ncbi:MAG: hypothetical protein AAF581_09465 [Planctomycetota bacterium]
MTLLRWLLAVGNISLLALVSFFAAGFFHLTGDGMGLQAKLERPSSVKVAIPTKREASYPQLTAQLYEVEPVKPPPPEPVKQPDPGALPPEVGGPLQEWEVTSVLVDPQGSLAFIAEKGQTTTAATGRSSGRRSGARRNSRAPRGRSAASQRQIRTLQIGMMFRGCEVNDIRTDPPRVFYSQGQGRQRRQYILEQPAVESRIRDVIEGGRRVAIEIDGQDDVEQIAKKAAAKEKAGPPSSSRGRRNKKGRRSNPAVTTLTEAKEALEEEERGGIVDALKDGTGKVRTAKGRRQ